MKADAEAHAEEDKKRREVVDLKNRGDGLIAQTRKALDEHGDKVSGEVRSKIESAISNAEDKLKGDEKEPIEAALRELETASSELGKIVYEQAAKEAGGESAAAQDASNANASSGDDDVIDAEFEVKDEADK